MFNKGFVKILFILLLTACFVTLQGQNTQVTITGNDINNKGIALAGFTLESRQNVQIEAIGAGGEKEIRRISNWQQDKFNLYAYSWIIDARTRKQVWRMTVGNTEGDWWDKFNRVFTGSVELPKGEYELYFSAIEPSYFAVDGGFMSFGRIMDKMMGEDEWWEDHSSKWKVTVKGVDEVFNTDAVRKYQQAVKNSAIINMSTAGDEEYLSNGFSLKKDVKLRIYAIGEGYKGEMFDYAWIVDANTREKVWQMDERETEYAGGAFKNRLIDKNIQFRSGDYIVYYKSDDSHSYREWNANPPYDPNFWGISIYGADRDFDKSIVAEYAPDEGSVIIRLNRVGDDESLSEGFTLLKPAKVRIYALGEGTDGKMYDYGWIEDGRTGRKIWMMDYYDTDHAGGDDKNRLADVIITLDPGSYFVRYVTDGSHSYNDWNRPKPYDPKSWGIALYSVATGNISDIIKPYKPEDNRNILVQLIQVGNDEHVRKQFRIESESKVRVYAIGEGDWDEMYDYGWIEDFNTGEIVWEMRYSETRRAGGGSKNRLFDKVIRLKRGTYIAHYRTDDSHAYRSWNVKAPSDPANYGLTVYLIKD